MKAPGNKEKGKKKKEERKDQRKLRAAVRAAFRNLSGVTITHPSHKEKNDSKIPYQVPSVCRRLDPSFCRLVFPVPKAKAKALAHHRQDRKSVV